MHNIHCMNGFISKLKWQAISVEEPTAVGIESRDRLYDDL